MDIFIIARCAGLSQEQKKERIEYFFKINGHLFGKYIRVANLLSINKLSIGDEYLLCVKIKKVSLGVVVGEILSAKKIRCMRRDIF